MKTFPGNSSLIDEYNELCAKGFGIANHRGLTFHHILPRCEFPELKDDPDNWTWLSFEDHWLAHYLLWKATGLPAYASAFWFICVYGLKNRGMTISDEDYAQLKKDIAKHNAERRKQNAKRRLESYKASHQLHAIE